MDDYDLQKIETEYKCPDCKKGYLIEWHEQNGPDDYTRYAECKSCGACFSE